MRLARRIEYVSNGYCRGQRKSNVRRPKTERPSSGQKRAERCYAERHRKRQWNRDVKIAKRISRGHGNCDRVDRRNPFKQTDCRDRR